MLTVDLTDPLLLAAVRALAPVALRVGGSLADQVTYRGMPGMPGAEAQTPCEPFARDPGRRVGFRGGCLTWERWVDSR